MKKSFWGTVLLLLSSTCFGAQAVLFLSLGMPDNALKAYFIQSKQYHMPQVIRGLYTAKHNWSASQSMGSFRDTANRVKAIVKRSTLGGISIDPLLFRAFDIKVVPALVLYDDHLPCIKHVGPIPYASCPTKTFDVLYGNLPIQKLLKNIADQSTHADRAAFARALLSHTRKEGERA